MEIHSGPFGVGYKWQRKDLVYSFVPVKSL